VEGGRASYRRRHGHEMVAPATCMVAHPMLASMLFGVDFGPETTGVVGRVGIHTGDRLMVLAPRAPGLTVPAGTHLVGRDRPKAVREAFIHEVVSKRRWRISADSFFQSGPQAAELLIDVVASAVADALPTGGVVLDAYAGVGILGGELARTHGARVVAVESNRRAVSDARANLADLDATVIHGQVADQARWLKADPPALASHRRGPIFDVVVADPARPGLGKAAAAGLAALGSPRLVLASCDPASMARDVALLATHGYELTSLTVLDLFPDTFHVETVARFDLSRWTH
ncbi:MAG: RsmD family RNA methyltransferase, partial [Acidimicrobiales bacterium]